jgi:hypothetical protein
LYLVCLCAPQEMDADEVATGRTRALEGRSFNIAYAGLVDHIHCGSTWALVSTLGGRRAEVLRSTKEPQARDTIGGALTDDCWRQEHYRIMQAELLRRLADAQSGEDRGRGGDGHASELETTEWGHSRQCERRY